MVMKKWWWRIALVVIGLVLIAGSVCLVAYSHLQRQREVQREVVPVEMPLGEPTPESWLWGWEVV
jgi:multisubunit Na+/H+ antiporter MnhE subunit